jgi:hypothetical protein
MPVLIGLLPPLPHKSVEVKKKPPQIAERRRPRALDSTLRQKMIPLKPIIISAHVEGSGADVRKCPESEE